jgi:hypothetical protein
MSTATCSHVVSYINFHTPSFFMIPFAKSALAVHNNGQREQAVVTVFEYVLISKQKSLIKNSWQQMVSSRVPQS